MAFLADALSVLVVRSPHHRAAFSFGDIDAFVAEHPGIAAAFTAADIPGRNRFGTIAAFADQPALAEGSVRFRGEAVAVIAGEREAIADLAIADFPVAWTVLPHMLSSGEATADSAILLHPEPRRQCPGQRRRRARRP